MADLADYLSKRRIAEAETARKVDQDAKRKKQQEEAWQGEWKRERTDLYLPEYNKISYFREMLDKLNDVVLHLSSSSGTIEARVGGFGISSKTIRGEDVPLPKNGGLANLIFGESQKYNTLWKFQITLSYRKQPIGTRQTRIGSIPGIAMEDAFYRFRDSGIWFGSSNTFVGNRSQSLPVDDLKILASRYLCDISIEYPRYVQYGQSLIDLEFGRLAIDPAVNKYRVKYNLPAKSIRPQTSYERSCCP